jgi:predicted small integral membrane protein
VGKVLADLSQVWDSLPIGIRFAILIILVLAFLSFLGGRKR